jgi:hypothetical protein
MRKQILVLSTAMVGLTSCSNQLDVKNVTQPDVSRVLATPALIEGVVGGLGLLVFNPERASESVNTQSKVLAAESWGSVANFGIAVRAAVPHSALISNELGNDNQIGNLANFQSFSIASRTASNTIKAFDKVLAAGQTLGSSAQDQRARAFSYLVLGEAMGNLSLAYDSAAIVSVKLAAEDIPPLSGAADVAKAALGALDSAIAIASSAAAQSGSNGFPLPATWLNGLSVSRTDFIKMARSFKARYRAGVARTPTERAAVDWSAVIADATNGIAADVAVQIGNGSGWSAQFDENTGYVNGYSMMPMYYWGMADTSLAYDAWLATPRDQRRAFLVQTPDSRWPSGATRAAQQSVTAFASLPTPSGQIIRNRPTGEDIVVTGYGDTWYENRRYGSVNAAGHIGAYIDFSKVENDMLAAEGYIRTGNVPAAAALVNISRVRNGLSSVLGVTSATSPISTATSCVPRVPVGPNFTSTACGNLFEAMKYEKRVETAETGYMIWFTDSRGWGDLLENTVIEWPVPYQEMQARLKPFYNGTRAQGKGTYGF